MTEKKNDKKEASAQPLKLAISKIFVPKNLRREGWEKDIGNLVTSIKHSGLQQPPKVREYESGEKGPNGETHKLVFGFRRLTACKKLGWTTIPVVLMAAKGSDRDAFIARLAENFGRQDLSPMEEAQSLRHAITELGFTAKQLTQRIGKTDGYISQRLALLRMPDDVQKAVESEQISPTHARELARVTDPKEQKKLLAEAKHTPLPEFKEKIEAATSKRESNRGRKAKPEKPGDKDTGKVPAGSVRSKPELKKALGDLDNHLQCVTKVTHTDADVRFVKGMIRGVGWAGGMVKELLPKI